MKKIMFLLLLTAVFLYGCASAEKTEEKNEVKNNLPHLQWSSRSSEKMDWQGALNYCKNVSDGGFKDWRLPNIDELRESFVNCSKTVPAGECRVSGKKGCLSSNCKDPQDSCSCKKMKNDGFYSVLEDPDYVGLWSSSSLSDDTNRIWGVVYYSAMVGSNKKSGKLYARCVRTADETDNRVYLGGGKAIIIKYAEEAVIEEYISKNFPKIRRCYEIELEKNPNLAGRINITFVISKTGSVIGPATVGRSSLDSADVAECIAKEVEKIKFPPTNRGKNILFMKSFVFNREEE